MSCPVCLRSYKNSTGRRPKVLQCGHDFCEKCLEKIHDSEEKIIICPSCRVHTKSSPKDIGVAHSFLEILSSKYKTEVEEAKTVCENDGCNEAVKKQCGHCDKYLCEKHLQEDLKVVVEKSKKLLADNSKDAAGYQRKQRIFLGHVDRKLKKTEVKTKNIKEEIDKLKETRIEMKTALDKAEKDAKDYRKDIESKAKRIKEALLGLQQCLDGNCEDVDEIWEKYNLFKSHLKDTQDDNETVLEVPVIKDGFNPMGLPGLPFLPHPRGLLEGMEGGKRLKMKKLNSGERRRNTLISPQKMHSTNVALNDEIGDVAVCYNTHGISCGGKDLPETILIVKLKDNNKRLLQFGLDGSASGGIMLSLKLDEVKLENLAVQQEKQRVFISDSLNSCVHVIGLNGQAAERPIKREAGLGHPACMVVDERSEGGRLYVSDIKEFRVHVFDLKDYSFLAEVKEDCLRGLAGISVNPDTGDLWTVSRECHEGLPKMSISIFTTHNDKFELKKQQDDLEVSEDDKGEEGLLRLHEMFQEMMNGGDSDKKKKKQKEQEHSEERNDSKTSKFEPQESAMTPLGHDESGNGYLATKAAFVELSDDAEVLHRAVDRGRQMKAKKKRGRGVCVVVKPKRKMVIWGFGKKNFRLYDLY